MSVAGESSAPDAKSLSARLANYRALVFPLIEEAIPDREPRKHLWQLVAQQLRREGKGIRPALCLATCRAFGGREDLALPSAAALELMHNAFLVHDDIEDESEFRRDNPTLHREYGVPLALNAGDAINALSVQLLKRNLTLLGPELSARIFDEFDHMSIETIEGQAMELGWIRDNACNTTEEDYLVMVLKKTGWYSFMHPARIGALIAAPQRSDLEAFNRFGYFLGTAFQIQDDVLNLVGDRKKYGKEIGGDLLEGKRTLMLTHLLQHANAQERARLQAFLGKPRAQRSARDVAWISELMRTYGSIQYAQGAARQFANGAQQEFERAYASATAGPDLDFLRALVEYTISREV